MCRRQRYAFEGVHVCVCLRRKACVTVLLLGWHGFRKMSVSKACWMQ